VQLTLPNGGKLLLVDCARWDQLSVLDGTCCNKSTASLAKALARPLTRAPSTDLAIVPRLLRSVLDGQSRAQLFVCISDNSTSSTTDLLRLAQQASKSVKPKKGKDTDLVARQQATVELLQSKIVEEQSRGTPSVDEIEQTLIAAAGSDSSLDQMMRSAQEERVQLEKMLEAMRDESSRADHAEADEALQKTWAAEEAKLRSELTAQNEEAEKLIAALDAAGALKSADDLPPSPQKSSSSKTRKELELQVERYEQAVHSAWEDIQRAQQQASETKERFERLQLTHQHSAADREEMESTLLDVAADLENLARNYRQHGSPAMAVPLYVSALAIFEKTLGAEHPQVASNLVNLGNAFCDQQKHIEAVPVYLRALAIDEKALGHDHPEVAMDLSNLGIAYRALGRADIANGLFERAYKLMLNAVGPDDPKTKAIERNLV